MMGTTIQNLGSTDYEAQTAAVADAEGEAPVEVTPTSVAFEEPKKKRKPPMYTNDAVSFEGDYGLNWTSTDGFVLEHTTAATISPDASRPNAPKLYFEESGSGSIADPNTFSGTFKAGPRIGIFNILGGYVQAAEPKLEDLTDINNDGKVDESDIPPKDEPFIGAVEVMVLNQKKLLSKPNLKAGFDFTGVELRNFKLYAKGWQPISDNFYMPYSFVWNPTRVDSNASLFGESLPGDNKATINHKVEAQASLLVHFEDSDRVSKYAMEFGAKYTHNETVTTDPTADELSTDSYAGYDPYSNGIKVFWNQYLPFGKELTRDQIVNKKTPLTFGVSYEYGQSINLGPWQGNGTEGYSEPTRNLSETTSYREEVPAVTSKLGFDVNWNILALDVTVFPKQLDTSGSQIVLGVAGHLATDLTGQKDLFDDKYVGFTLRLTPAFTAKKPAPKE